MRTHSFTCLALTDQLVLEMAGCPEMKALLSGRALECHNDEGISDSKSGSAHCPEQLRSKFG